MKELLVIVDYQNDFVSGSLGFDGGEALEPGILHAADDMLARGGYVLITKDTHGDDYLETREGTFLPVPHCVKGTKGHDLFGRLADFETRNADNNNVHTIEKPTFGSKDIAAEAEKLVGTAPDEITLCGVATNICVISNAIILHTAFPDAIIKVNAALSGSGDKKAHDSALLVLEKMGFEILK